MKEDKKDYLQKELKERLYKYIQGNFVQDKKTFCSYLSGLFRKKSKKSEDLGNNEDNHYDDEEICDSLSLPTRASLTKEKASKLFSPDNIGKIRIRDYLQNRYQANAVAKKLNLYMFERDITTSMIYERCFVDRKLISKITSGSNYHPSKSTMLALCIGLQLSLQEAEEFLSLAGYSFSSGSKFDLIIKFMLENAIYDISDRFLKKPVSLLIAEKEVFMPRGDAEGAHAAERRMPRESASPTASILAPKNKNFPTVFFFLFLNKRIKSSDGLLR